MQQASCGKAVALRRTAHREREVVEERNRLIGVIEQQNRLLAAPVPAAKPSALRRPAAKKAVQAKPVEAETPLVAKKIAVETADSTVDLKRSKKKASLKKAETPKRATPSAKKPLKKNAKKALQSAFFVACDKHRLP